MDEMLLNRRIIGRSLAALAIAVVMSGLIYGLNITQSQAATAVWAPPAILLPYVGDNPSLCVNPLDSTISYFAGSGGYGMAVGSEGNNWLNGTFTKLSDQKGSGDCAYDEFGTLHAVWSLRNEAGNYNIFYNSVQKGSGNVPLYRNLSQELYGLDKYTIKADIAVSIPQHKVFITFQERREGGDALMFIESGNQGGSWSKPLQLGILSGYRPAEPDIIVDKAGLPHIFYGVFREGGPSIISHRMRRTDGSWTAPENILGDKQTRPIWTQAELDPVSGDIYVSWLEGQSGVSRWNAATGKWTYSENISDSSPRASFPTIAVNSQTGTVWDIWTDDSDIWARQSTDKGTTWLPRERVVNLGAAKIGRMFGLKARSTRGIIYLLISADQLNPLYYVGPTLQLQTFNQSIFSQPTTPTATPLVTATPAGTATPQIQPTITPQPTVTPQPTATPMPTATPQPTATPHLVPTIAPTQTATQAPTSAPQIVATSPQVEATAIPKVANTALPLQPTATPQSAPAQVPQVPQPTKAPVIVNPTAPATQTPVPTAAPTSTPLPAATLEPGILTATAAAQAQAAAKPQSIVIPLAPVGSGGKGPELVIPTATAPPLPTFTAGFTVTPAPTRTAAATATASIGPATAVTSTPAVSEHPAQPQPMPPSPGALWILPIGLAMVGKGFLNLVGLLAKS